MTRPVEERLRAAMRARAGQITADGPAANGPPPLVPSPARPLAVSPARPLAVSPAKPVRLARWVPPLAIAAVAAVAVAVPGIFAAQQLLPDRLAAQPGYSGARLPPPSAPAPTLSLTPNSARAELAARPPAPGAPAQAPSPAEPAPVHGPATVNYYGTTVDIPSGWTFQEHVADPGWACVWMRAPDRCELTFAPPGAGYHLVHPDDPRPVAAQLDCLDISAPVQKLAASVVDIGGRSADYRRWRMNCMGIFSDFEQWTIPTYPAAKFHREHPDPETEDAAKSVLASVRFAEAPTGDLVTDFGFILGYQRTSAGVQLTFDRATPVWRGLHHWDFENTNPATYRYLLDPETLALFGGSSGICQMPDVSADECGVDTFLRRLDEGEDRSDGGQPIPTIAVWLRLDGGRVESITPA